jgi:hypothetical protein
MDKEKDFLKLQKNQISKQYKDAAKIYDRQAAELQQLQPQYEQSIIQGYEAQKPILQQQATTAMEGLGLQKEQTKGARESALSTARRQYEQGLQKSQQIFGGVAGSSAGMASADILGAEQLRQIGQAQTQSAQNLMQIGTQERDVQAQLTNALSQLEVKKSQDLMKLRDSFRQELNQINQAKGTLSMNKATAQLSALQDYNTRRRALDDMVTEQKMNLETYAQQLRLANQYNSAQTATLPIPNFKGLSDQERSNAFRTLLGSTQGQNSLTLSGFSTQPVGGRTVVVNEYTGETYDLSGRRYADFAVPEFTTRTQLKEEGLSNLGQIQGPQR